MISERDVAALSAAESQRHWQAAASKRGDFIAQAMEVTYLDTAMSPQLGAEVAVPMTSPTPTFRMSPPTQLQQSPPPTLPAMAVPFSSTAPVEQSLDWRTLSPSVQTVVDVSQYLAPLQQLVGLLSSRQPSTEGVATAASPVVAAPPEPEPQLCPQLPAVPTPSTPPPQPAPAESESLDVLDSLPTREECRALRQSRCLLRAPDHPPRPAAHQPMRTAPSRGTRS